MWLLEIRSWPCNEGVEGEAERVNGRRINGCEERDAGQCVRTAPEGPQCNDQDVRAPYHSVSGLLKHPSDPTDNQQARSHHLFLLSTSCLSLRFFTQFNTLTPAPSPATPATGQPSCKQTRCKQLDHTDDNSGGV